MDESYEIGEVVYVTQYYDDMIVKERSVGLITDVDKYSWLNVHGGKTEFEIYKILDSRTNTIVTAEKFALSKLKRELEDEG